MAKIKKITKILPEIKEHVVMRDHTTLRVGGVADYFYEACNIEGLIRAVKLAIEYDLPYFILGNGSNVLFSDYGYAGLIIKNSSANIAVMKEKSQIIADSGALLSRLIMQAATNDLAGLEFLYGVPGTVGGALYGNAGAFGSSIGDYTRIVTLLIINPEGIAEIVQHDGLWMDFGYRSSKLKGMKGKSKPVILSAKFQLCRNQKDEIMQRLNKMQKDRKETQPWGFSAGSIFKNPIPQELANITGKGTSGMPEVPKERSAGYLLESSGVKKLRVGDAEVSGKHANFIINRGEAKASEIRTLIEAMREKVVQKYDITLEEEIEYVGQW